MNSGQQAAAAAHPAIQAFVLWAPAGMHAFRALEEGDGG